MIDMQFSDFLNASTRFFARLSTPHVNTSQAQKKASMGGPRSQNANICNHPLPPHYLNSHAPTAPPCLLSNSKH